MEKRSKIVNVFTKQILADFAADDGRINWSKLVEFNSGNLDIELK
jgi:hypothetical protein